MHHPSDRFFTICLTSDVEMDVDENDQDFTHTQKPPSENSGKMLQSLYYMYWIYFSAYGLKIHLIFSYHAFQKYLKLIQAVSVHLFRNIQSRKGLISCN